MLNKNYLKPLLVCLFGISACHSNPPVSPTTPVTPVSQAQTHKKLVVLDSGHTPTLPGALSWTNHKEVEYNDAIVSVLANKLATTDASLLLTRQPGQAAQIPSYLRTYLANPISESEWARQDHLYGRIALANYNKADLFIAIHHDSVQEKYLKPAEYNHEKSFLINSDFYAKFKVGYSIYLAKDGLADTNPTYQKSLRFAKILAARLQKLGRTPSTHHDENTKGEAYEIIDSKLGIYNGKRLAILRNAQVPAVLVEVGVLLDPTDEKLVSSPAFKNAFAQAVTDSVNEFLR